MLALETVSKLRLSIHKTMIINFHPRSRHRAVDSREEGKTAGTEIFSLFATVVYSSVTRDERRLEGAGGMRRETE